MTEETNRKQAKEDKEKENTRISFDESNDRDDVHIVQEDFISTEPSSSGIDELKEQVEKLSEEVEEKRQQFLRARADLENYRRRSRKEMEDMMKYASLPLVEALLPVLDNFERALEAADQSQESNSFYEGIEMVYRQLQSALQDAGLSRIEAKGEVFDPHQHNAVMQEENDEAESNTVLDELQVGYRFVDRIVRPTMVKISK